MFIRMPLVVVLLAGSHSAQTPPRVWINNELNDWPAPVAGLGVRPCFFSEREYYAVPGDNLRTYPVYSPDR